MAATTTQDTDELIILDDVATTSEPLSSLVIEDTPDSSDLISFDIEESKTPEVASISLETEVKAESTPEIVEETAGAELDFGELSTQETPTLEMETEKTEVSLDMSEATMPELTISDQTEEKADFISDTTVEPTLDLGITEETTAIEPVSEAVVTSSLMGEAVIGDDSSSGDDSSMDDILDETISKLSARLTIVDADIKDETDLEADLQRKLKESEETKAELQAESKKISANIKSLEKMKLATDAISEAKSTTSKKVHNTKRKAA